MVRLSGESGDGRVDAVERGRGRADGISVGLGQQHEVGMAGGA